MTTASPLDRLAHLHGIEPGYTDIWQREHRIGTDTKRILLKAMGVPAQNDVEVEASLDSARKGAFEPLLPKVVVRRAGPRSPCH